MLIIFSCMHWLFHIAFMACTTQDEMLWFSLNFELSTLDEHYFTTEPCGLWLPESFPKPFVRNLNPRISCTSEIMALLHPELWSAFPTDVNYGTSFKTVIT